MPFLSPLRTLRTVTTVLGIVMLLGLGRAFTAVRAARARGGSIQRRSLLEGGPDGSGADDLSEVVTKANRLTHLCKVCKNACNIISPVVEEIYSKQPAVAAKSSDSLAVVSKDDGSAFTLADGLVQYLLANVLFKDKLRAIVGEEGDVEVVRKDNILRTVSGIDIPAQLVDAISNVESAISKLSLTVDSEMYGDITAFIDPIDGTKEFTIGQGTQCSICIGFASNKNDILDYIGEQKQGAHDAGESRNRYSGVNSPVAGIVYRPIGRSYAMGCAYENYPLGFAETNVDRQNAEEGVGFLTSNGAISPFIDELMLALKAPRVKSGGVGNKVLMLLEGQGQYYIQDRGVSRWDTCGPAAVLEAFGGALYKLRDIERYLPLSLTHPKLVALRGYAYLQGHINADFEEGLVKLTKFNRGESVDISGDAAIAMEARHLKSYANTLGMVALAPRAAEAFHASCRRLKDGEDGGHTLLEALAKAKAKELPEYS